ncbi:MAG TPA: tryptophan synthase subunit alpha, partial [Chloroflexota bacterium]|nr:tryptophan synthase subunit alpha [Chloroflexota bacterium]
MVTTDDRRPVTDAQSRVEGKGRIAQTFERMRQKGSLALVGWQTIGYPEIGATERLVPALFEGGFDLFELGVPFSDPMADGATIQRSSQAALNNGTTTAHCFQAIRSLRKSGFAAPLLFMSYY